MSLHTLEEVPEVNREFLVIEHGKTDLLINAGSYQEIEDWLAGELIHSDWVRITNSIGNLTELGEFTRFEKFNHANSTQRFTTIIVFRIHLLK